jgi:hypothetical protein
LNTLATSSCWLEEITFSMRGEREREREREPLERKRLFCSLKLRKCLPIPLADVRKGEMKAEKHRTEGWQGFESRGPWERGTGEEGAG